MTIEDRIDGWVARSMYGCGAWQAALELARKHGMVNVGETLDRACREGRNPLAIVEDLVEADRKAEGPA